MEDHLTTKTQNESDSINLDSNVDNFKYLIDLLEFEIKNVRSEESKPGWTTWALIASLASMLWLLTQELEHSMRFQHPFRNNLQGLPMIPKQ